MEIDNAKVVTPQLTRDTAGTPRDKATFRYQRLVSHCKLASPEIVGAGAQTLTHRCRQRRQVGRLLVQQTLDKCRTVVTLNGGIATTKSAP